MNIPIVLSTVGNLVLMLAGILLIPLGVAFYYEDDSAIWAFIYTIIITGVLGGLSKAFFRKKNGDINIREGIAIVTFSWLVCIFLGALPFWCSGVCTTYCDAVFETTSGFTTTGSSIFKDVEILPHSILFWRAFTNWLGGMGIIVIFVALLPAMGVSGYQLFSAEVSGPTADRLRPRIGETAKLLWIIYIIFTASMIVILFCGGMAVFDAICHTFTTVSTGGFSIKNTSTAYYNSLYVEIVTAAFMFICGCNFALYYKCFQKEFKKVLKNSELRFFAGLILRPRMVKHVKLNGESVSEEIITECSVFFVVYLGFFGVCSLALMSLNTDIITAFSAVATCMANCGPGLAKVGPMANFSDMTYAGKWILSFCMLLGRLEIYGLILLFLPITWKR